MFEARKGYSWHELMSVKEWRPLLAGRSEESPDLVVSAHVYRNGGADDPVCDGCLLVGLLRLRVVVNQLVEVLSE